MSDTSAPDNRAIASARRPPNQPWYIRHQKPLLIGSGAAAILGLTWAMMPAHSPPVEAYKSQAKASHTDYEGPKGVVLAAAQTPVVTPEQRQKLIEALTDKKKDDTPQPHHPVMVTYGGASGQLPEYMKPKAPTDPVTEASHSTIAYKPVAFEGSKSVTITNRNLVLLPGALSCVMDTTIVTVQEAESPFMCHFDHNVLSPTNVTLMEAGTQVIGSYKSVAGEGQNRVIAVSASAITPNGVMVQLGGPIADQLGAAGVPGSVDTHFWQKFGPAMLLSLFDAGTQLASSALQSGNGNQTLNIGSGLQGGPFSQITHSMLEQQIRIPPTISINQGTRVMLWVTKIISFADSYRLEPK